MILYSHSPLIPFSVKCSIVLSWVDFAGIKKSVASITFFGIIGLKRVSSSHHKTSLPAPTPTPHQRCSVFRITPGLIMVGCRWLHSLRRYFSASYFVERYRGAKKGALADEIITKLRFLSAAFAYWFSSCAMFMQLSLFTPS